MKSRSRKKAAAATASLRPAIVDLHEDVVAGPSSRPWTGASGGVDGEDPLAMSPVRRSKRRPRTGEGARVSTPPAQEPTATARRRRRGREELVPASDDEFEENELGGESEGSEYGSISPLRESEQAVSTSQSPLFGAIQPERRSSPNSDPSRSTSPTVPLSQIQADDSFWSSGALDSEDVPTSERAFRRNMEDGDGAGSSARLDSSPPTRSFHSLFPSSPDVMPTPPSRADSPPLPRSSPFEEAQLPLETSLTHFASQGMTSSLPSRPRTPTLSVLASTAIDAQRYLMSPSSPPTVIHEDLASGTKSVVDLIEDAPGEDPVSPQSDHGASPHVFLAPKGADVLSLGRSPSPPRPHDRLSPSAASLGSPRLPERAPLPPSSSSSIPAPPPVVLPAPPVLVAVPDAALEQFRTARTFRTRTTLQLQPYTRERQLYEATLRRGGLKKGKHVVAPAREVARDDEADDDDEGQASSSSSASGVQQDPERIVIGGTPPAAKVRRERKIEDADFDAFFVEYGRAADEEDESDRKALQKLARTRVRAYREEKRKAREAERARKRFESLMRGKETVDDSDQQAEADPRRRGRTSTSRTPGKTKTYGKKSRKHARPPSEDDDRIPELPPRVPLARRSAHTSDSDTIPDLPPPVPPPRLTPSGTSQVDEPETSFRTPLSAVDDNGQMYDPGSFFVNGMPLPQHKRPQSISSDSETSTSSSRSESAHDPRAKIARKMMPAFMLRRLEREAAEKERRKAEAKQREQRRRAADSPARPGRAVVRRGRADGGDDFADFLEDVASQDEESQLRAHDRFRGGTPGIETPQRTSSRDQPIIISDDDGSDSSQAMEDNGPGERSLARLYEGDFDSIVVGRKRRETFNARKGSADRSHGRENHRRRHRRPALGFAKPTRKALSTGNKSYVQTRLDFPSEDTPSPRSNSKKTPSKKRKDFSRAHRDRPAIRLDDHVIFATADFAFDTVDDEVQEINHPGRDKPTKQPRTFQRTISRTFTTSPAAKAPAINLDDGIGKARSWANFDKFPIDFGISPLPSGIYCGTDTVFEDRSIERLVRLVRGEVDGAGEAPRDITVQGIELKASMPSEEVLAVLPIVLEGIGKGITDFVNGATSEKPDASPLSFLGRYIVTTPRADLLEACNVGVADLTARLDDLAITGSKFARPAREAMLDLRWRLFDCALRLACSSDANPTAKMLVQTCGTTLLQQLLSAGFDKTVKPLKAIMRAESDTAEIADQSVAIWVATMHALSAWDDRQKSDGSTFITLLSTAMDSSFRLDQTGPIAAERIWFLVFGLCALSQFDASGRITGSFVPAPRWDLVRRAISLIKISHNEEAEEKAHLDQLRGRDRYIRAMIARCVRLSAVWKWSFDRASFSIVTKDLGTIFKDRQHRNLPTEAPVDYPAFITRFDMALTAEEDTRHETAFELYLRLVCDAASDLISSATTLIEAQQAERDVQRLIMSTIPVSPVKFSRLFPPTARQLGQLINRNATMIAACYFAPSLLGWLLANSKKWSPFEQADLESRQISIRGLMYLAVACRHHELSLQPVVTRLAEILGVLQSELDQSGRASLPAQAPSRKEIERTMVLVVACFRQIILHHSFDVEKQQRPVYPDPCLLHESWTARIFALDLSTDLKCASEVVSTIQAFLDVRSTALPRLARQRREAKEANVESQDEFSLGIDFSEVDLAALGGDGRGDGEEDPLQKLEEEFAKIITTVISPQVYRLLSDMLPAVVDDDEPMISLEVRAERQAFIGKLTKCWSDCAGVVVVEQNSADGWTTYVGPFGKESWQRLRNEHGRLQVGLHFMLNVARIDPGCFAEHDEVFLALLCQSIVTDKLTIEHKFLSAVLRMPGAVDHPLLSELGGHEVVGRELDRAAFMQVRPGIVEGIFTSIPSLLGSSSSPASLKALIYRCINLLVSAFVSNENAIDPTKVIHRESYHAFAISTVRDLQRLAGRYITPMTVPGLKAFSSA